MSHARIFISYSHADDDVVKKLAGALREAGHEIWLYGTSSIAGSPILSEIEEALGAADFFVVCISRVSIQSRWVAKEIEISCHMEVYGRLVVLPVRLDDTPLPRSLARFVAVDLFPSQSTFEIGLERVLAAIVRGPAGGSPIHTSPPQNISSTACASIVQRSVVVPNLTPNPPADIVARPDKLREMQVSLNVDGVKVLAIVGPPGFGKSTLLAQFLLDARRSTHGTPGCILYYDYRQGGDVDLARIANDLGKALGMAEAFSSAAKTNATKELINLILTEALRLGRTILAIDNFERILDENAAVRDADLDELFRSISSTENNIQLIVASRAHPRFTNEAHKLSLGEGLPAVDAEAFLMKAFGGRKDISEAQKRESSGEWAKGVGYVPLALRWVAGRIKRASFCACADLGAPEEPDDGIQRLLAEHIGGLSHDAQSVLRTLAIFPNSVEISILGEVSQVEDISAVAQRLRDDELIRIDGELCDLHALVRDRILASTASDVRRALHLRAAKAYLCKSDPRSENWRSISDIEPQLRRFHHLVEARAFKSATKLMSSIQSNALMKWGYYRDVVERRMILASGMVSDPLGRCRNLRAAGAALTRSGEQTRAIRILGDALDLAERVGNATELMLGLNDLGVAHFHDCAIDAAVNYYQRSAAIAREHQKTDQLIIRLSNLAEALVKVARLTEARACITEATDLLEADERQSEIKMGRARLESLVAFDDAQIDLALGRIAHATRKMELSLMIARGGDERYREGARCCALGRVEILRGNFNAAGEYGRAAIKIHRNIGHRGGLAKDLLLLGEAEHRLGRLKAARVHYREACALETKATLYRAHILQGIAALADNDRSAAVDLIHRGIMFSRECVAVTPRYFDAIYTEALGLLALERTREALSKYETAFDMTCARGNVMRAERDLELLEPAGLSTAALEAARFVAARFGSQPLEAH